MRNETPKLQGWDVVTDYQPLKHKANCEFHHDGSGCTCGTSVVHPPHYYRFVIEPVTFAVANNLPFDVANVVKYVCRADAKNGREDIKKAIRYCEMILERFDREDRVKAGESPQDVWKVKL